MSTQSITYAVAQDTIGNLWIASEEGVLKHNSKFYRIYNTYNGLPELFNNRTTEIFVDSKQQVWIGLERGVCVYDANLDVFKSVKSNGDINPSLINSITEDNQGNIWVGGYHGVWKYNVDGLSKELVKTISVTNIQAVKPYYDRVIFGTNKGLFVYSPNDDTLQEINIDKDQSNISLITTVDNDVIVGTKTGALFRLDAGLKEAIPIHLKVKIQYPITDVIKNKSQGIYIATDGSGLYQMDAAYSVIGHFKEDANNQNALSSNGIYDILLGEENILWIATYGGGINYFDSNRLPFTNIQHRFNDKNSIVSNFTKAIAEDANKNLWFGTKKGVSVWHRKTNKWSHIPNLSKQKQEIQDIVMALEPDNAFMWVGTYNHGLFKININTLQSVDFNPDFVEDADLVKKVYAVHKDSKGNIWVGGIEGNLSVINGTNTIESYPIQNVRSICETEGADILVSGRFGVYKINHETKVFGLIEPLEPGVDTLAYSTVNGVAEINTNQLVLATNGEGLVFYNPKNETVSKLTMYSGMPSDIVQGVITASDSSIWASTTKGLVNVVFKKNDTIINVFDSKGDGLASTEFNYGSYRKLTDSLFAFGGVNGVTLFNPNAIKGDNYKPKIVFDAFKLFNKSVKPGEGPLKKHINVTDAVILKHSENSVEIDFTGIQHNASSKIKYAYKLEGFDSDWSEPGLSNYAAYTNLSPDTYTFRVKAFNKYGIPGEERNIAITVLSPWWATNTAFVLYAIGLVLIILTIVHFTSVIVKKKNADEQINFFNNITHEIKTPLTILISSLDNITEHVGTAEDSKKRIKTTVKRINSLFEQMLNFQKVTSEDNLSIDISEINLDSYIKKRINNFEPLTSQNNLKIIVNNEWEGSSFYFDKDILDKIILNLISNAIKYSLENGRIIINLTKTNMRELRIEVMDEGIGIPKDQQKFILKRYYRARNVINSQRPGTGLGLMMIKKLLEKTGGSISFSSEENKGTTFRVVLKNLKFEYDKKIFSKDSTVKELEVETEDRSELDAFSDSKILVVEDNDELREVLVNTLGVYFQVFEASNGKEGLDMALQVFPDMILTDLIMPEMDGMQMARRLKEDINLNHIPVFMLTVLQNSAQKLESIETGISEYIEKPIDIKFLLAKMINTLKWQKQLREKYIHDNETDNALLFRNKNDQEFLENLENTVIENIENESFSVHDLSGCFSMSRTSLYMKLKNLVDLSPQDFIIHTKLKFAKKLLIEGECSIKEVAYRSGFSNPKYFSTSFKKFYKMTPSGFLDSLKQN
ncbi:hybrid sensor histidine kinase/response regulator transcription factor [Snuella sedimenti]|uniref:histidine kinase n=1 Tax=Snuella sedimenti TaxID=2798802 RepID=A0A8J7LYK0_9FLAO|nr:ATP-binding protein [Snuella sedimenti]MBJ6368501.1 response regulator [Snuella sedimenti]